MNKSEKQIVLNGIHIFSADVEKYLGYLRKHCKRGLRTGKLANIDCLIPRLRQLADELEIYMTEEFTLDDMQDYRE